MLTTQHVKCEWLACSKHVGSFVLWVTAQLMMLFEGEQKGTEECHFRTVPESCLKNVFGRYWFKCQNYILKNVPTINLLNKDIHQHHILHKLPGGVRKENQISPSKHDKELNATLQT